MHCDSVKIEEADRIISIEHFSLISHSRAYVHGWMVVEQLPNARSYNGYNNNESEIYSAYDRSTDAQRLRHPLRLGDSGAGEAAGAGGG